MVKPATKPTVSTDEQEYRKNLFPDVSSIKNKNALCTSCNKSVKELVLRGKCKEHPFLETLLCERCFEFFGDGEFSVDEDGSDKYCRWCGQGGTLFLCSTCSAGFCKKCIKRNLPRSVLNEVEDDNWKCFCCEVKPLYDLRAVCWAAKQYGEENIKSKGDGDSNRKRKPEPKASSESDQEEKEAQVKKKRKSSSKKERGPDSPGSEVRDKDRELKVGIMKMKDFVADTFKMIETAKEKLLEVRNKKVRNIKTEENLIKSSEKFIEFHEVFSTGMQKLRDNCQEYMTNWKKALEEQKAKVEETKKEVNNGSPEGSLGSGDEAEKEEKPSTKKVKKSEESEENDTKMEVDEDASKNSINKSEEGKSDGETEETPEEKKKSPRKESTPIKETPKDSAVKKKGDKSADKEKNHVSEESKSKEKDDDESDKEESPRKGGKNEDDSD